MKVVLKYLTKNLFLCLLAVVIAIPFLSIPTKAYGATFNDIRGHWAESYINKAVSAGFVKGYPDGDFRPDNAVTRAEFTSMVNKALGNTGTTSVSFSDVPYNEWYYNDIAKGMSAAFVGGYDNNTFRPNTPVTREEAAVMVSRFVPTYGTNGSTSSFKDRGSISTWAADAVARINGKGYMGSYPDGKYHPQDSLTRAQTAKIMCSILEKENIVSSSTIVKSKGTTLSNRIYTNNVTMHSDLGSGEAELSNCVVLGTLYVYGGGENTITVSNSRVANAFVEKSSSAVRVLAKGQTSINKTTTGNKAILETSGLSGGINGTGFIDLDIKSSAQTTLKGSFVRVNVTGSSADVDIESGSITTFNVNSSARNSDINLSSKANIGTANVNSSVAFRGSGSINTMNANSSGITYETKPRYLKLGSGISSPDYTDSDSDLDIKVSPKNKETKVNLNTDITLTFDTAVTKYNGSTIRNSDIPDLVYLRKDSSSGKKVSCSGSISSNRKVITLTPDSNLDDDTKYYIVISKNQFLDTKDKGNSSQTTYFTTGDDSDGTLKFYPKAKASDVRCSVEPTITFSEYVETYDGKSISSSYIENNIIFREDNSSGRKVSFDGRISKKTITLEPRSSLKEGQKYYIEIPSRKFRTQSDRTNISSYSVTWTTTSPSAPTVSFNPSNGSANVALNSNITLNFSTGIYDTSGYTPSTWYLTSYITLRNNTTNSNVPCSVVSFSNYSGGASLVLKPSAPSTVLTSGHNYTISLSSDRFKNSSGTYMGSASASFTASNNIDVSSINTAINSANSAISSVNVSINGSDIYEGLYWVTQQQVDTLKAAINTAVKARDTVTTIDQAKAAASSLDIATKAFLDGKKTGTKFRIDISALTNAINTAYLVKSGVQISEDGFDFLPNIIWVNKRALDDFNIAISKAESMKSTINDFSQVNSETKSLNDAITSFKSQIQNGKKANNQNLEKAIVKANALLKGVSSSDSSEKVPVGTEWVTYKEFGDFTSKIDIAIKLSNTRDASQAAVDQAENDINTAIDDFIKCKKPGTMPVNDSNQTN